MRSDTICTTCCKYLNGCVPAYNTAAVTYCEDYAPRIVSSVTMEGVTAEKIKEGSIKESDVKLSDIKPDMVNHPPHYTKGGIECLDAIRASMTDDEYKGYLKGNIIKYLWRYELKNGLEDLKKAQFYQNKLIEIVQAEKVRGDSMHT